MLWYCVYMGLLTLVLLLWLIIAFSQDMPDGGDDSSSPDEE